MHGVHWIGLSAVTYNESVPNYVLEYYRYCVRVLCDAVRSLSVPINVIFGHDPGVFPNNNPVVRVWYQFEHTLIRPFGYDLSQKIVGTVSIAGSDARYLVEIQNYEFLNEMDIILEYSIPNVINVGSADCFSDYARRVIYVAPAMHERKFSAAGRDIGILALGQVSHRRLEFAAAAKSAGLDVTYVSGVFDGVEVRKLYERTNILVNVRQQYTQATLEELRVLPALMSGAIVLSEDVPLREQVPYHEHVLWTSFEGLLDALTYAVKNETRLRHEIFANSRLTYVLDTLQAGNVARVAAGLAGAVSRQPRVSLGSDVKA